MKRFLPGAICTLLICGSSPAFAQSDSYSAAKGGDHVMNDAQYMSPEENTASTAQTERQATVTAPAQTEPAAGYSESKKDSMQDFSGPYVGGDIGYNIGSYDTNDPAGPDGDVGLDGFEGGLFAGYGFSYDASWLGGYAGLEGGYEWSEADGHLGANSFEKDHAWLVTFRPGISMHEDALAYGIVGYSRANFESGGDDENLNGLVLGAGGEFSTRSPLKIRLEYTYTNYEDANLGGVNFDGHENQVKAGAVFRF